MKRPAVYLTHLVDSGARIKKISRIANNRIKLSGSNSSPRFPFQGDTEAWDVQVHDQKIKEATEKARHETFGECFLDAYVAV